MNSVLDKLIGALRQSGLVLDTEQLADSLWLAPYLPRTPPGQLRRGPAPKHVLPKKKKERKKERVADDRKSTTDPVSDIGRKKVADVQLPGLRRDDDSQGPARGLPIRLSGAASLPEALAIGRALRPLRKRTVTKRWFRLDEKRTAERLAAVDIWMPVLLPGRERWLNATIIVDAGASMAIWRSMVNEFRGILQSLGAFRKIEVRRMDTDEPGNSVPVFASGRSTTRHDPLDLADPSGRTFFLVISDCVGGAWWDGRVGQLFELWGRTNHAAVLQILPREMWDRTALGTGRAVSLTSPRAVCPNANLAAFATGKFQSNVKLDAKNSVPVPVLELGAGSLATWARDAVSTVGSRFLGRLLRTKPAPAPHAKDDYWSQSLSDPFLTVASLPARKLANLMAAAPPFNLPLLRVIRESRLSGDATQIHEAEFLLSGLLTVVSNKDARVDDPDRVIYDFKSPQLRAMLRSALHVSEAMEVMNLDEVGEYLGRQLGRPGVFPAVIRAPHDYAGTLSLGSTEDRDPIARFTADMLQWFGGKYAELLSVKKDEQEPSFTWEEDHKNVVWYIRGSSSGDESSAVQASAVAVRVRREGESARTCLLTCAHVVRGLKSIRAWRAGTASSAEHARTLRVVATGNGRPDERVVADQQNASSDWALLEIEDITETLSAPAVPYWAELNPAGQVSICGYPGGDTAFRDGVVRPRILNLRLTLNQADQGLLRFVGDRLRPGMSGAGVFDAVDRFVGIHRSSHDAIMELVAISADFIRQRLMEFGFHVVTVEDSTALAPVEELAKILDEEFQEIDWRRVSNRVLPWFSTDFVSRDRVDDKSLIEAFREFEKSRVSVRGIQPLHEFAFEMSRMRPVTAIHVWIHKHVPPETRKICEATDATAPKGQPIRPEVSVLVAGTARHKLPPAVQDAAGHVGLYTASRGFGLVTGGRHGVDHVAANEYADILDRGNLEFNLTQVVDRGIEPHFNRGRVIEVANSRDEYVLALKLASAVIIVGGATGTRNVAEHAVRMQVPVFPLPWTGGHAAEFHRQVLANWAENKWMGMSRDQFEALSNSSDALDIIAEHLQPTGQYPKWLPQEQKAASMLFVASKPPVGPRILTDEELRSIEAIFKGNRSDRLALDFKFDVTWEEFQTALASGKPSLLHFCGHSAGGYLVFRDSSSGPKRVDPAAFAAAIAPFGGSLRVIVLNADEMGAFAKSVTDRLPDSVVIAPERVVTDEEAIRFANDFYGQLADGNTVRRAFMYASQPPTGSTSGGAYSMWSNSADPDQLTAKSGFIDRRQTKGEQEFEAESIGDPNPKADLEKKGLGPGSRREEDDFAVVVGISRYLNGLPELPWIVRNTASFRQWLLDVANLPAQNVHTILSGNTSESPSAADVESVLLKLVKQYSSRNRRGRRLYLYFAGHGVNLSGQQISDISLLTAASVVPYWGDAIPCRAWADYFREGGLFEEVVLLVDCSRAARMRFEPRTLPMPLQHSNHPARFFYAFAYSENDRGGDFTTALLEGLNGGAVDADRKVTASRLSKYIGRRMQKENAARALPEFHLNADDDLELLALTPRRTEHAEHAGETEGQREEFREALLKELEVGQIRKGVVRRIAGFGAFIDLGGIEGLLHSTDMSWERIGHPSEILAIDQEIEVKVLRIDQEKKSIALGLKQMGKNPWEQVIDKYPPGSTHKGSVVKMMHYGAFVKLEPGIEGLVHVSEMSERWRVNHPSELVDINDEIRVMVLAVDTKDQHLYLGMKQTEKPWTGAAKKYAVDTIVTGKVCTFTNDGARVELEEGIEGLLHINDMSWTHMISHPNEMLELGQEVRCKILSVDQKRRRIAVGIKQLEADPWMTSILDNYVRGDVVTGTVTKISNFGVFVRLADGLEGLVHISELADHKVDNPVGVVKIGDKIEVMIIRIDTDERKIGLKGVGRRIARGIKQPEDDPWNTNILGKYAPGQVVTGTITKITNFGVFVGLADGLEGLVHISEIPSHIVENPEDVVQIGNKIEVKILRVDTDERKIGLSLKRDNWNEEQ